MKMKPDPDAYPCPYPLLEKKNKIESIVNIECALEVRR